MELLLIALLIVVGLAALTQTIRGDVLQTQNDYLRQENQSLRNAMTTGDNGGGGGCGAFIAILVVGLVALLVILDKVFAMLG